MNRDQILTTAGGLINGDRARDYGDASENFQRIADLITPVLAGKLKPGTRVDAHEVALILTQLKVACLITSPAHEDSWVDAAGYIALGGEIATRPALGETASPSEAVDTEWDEPIPYTLTTKATPPTPVRAEDLRARIARLRPPRPGSARGGIATCAETGATCTAPECDCTTPRSDT